MSTEPTPSDPAPGAAAPGGAVRRDDATTVDLLAAGGHARAAEPRPLWPWLLALGALLILAAGVAVIFVADDLTGRVAPLDLPRSTRLGLVPFVDAGGEQPWVPLGMSELVGQALADTPGIRVVPSPVVAEAIRRRGWPVSDPENRDAMRRLVLGLGAEVAVTVVVGQHDDGRWQARVSAHGPAGPIAETTAERDDPMALAAALVELLIDSVDPDVLPPDSRRLFSGSAFYDRLWATGVAALRSGDAAEAVRIFELCLEDRPRFLLARARLVEAVRATGDVERARTLLGALLAEAIDRGDSHLISRGLLSLAALTALAGDVETAEQQLTQADAVFLAEKDHRGRAEVLELRARLALADREIERAETMLFDLLEMWASIDDRVAQAETLMQLGSLALERGDVDAAADFLGQAEHFAEAAGDPRTAARVSSGLGDVARRRGELAEAEDRWRRAVAYHRDHDEPRRALALMRRLGPLVEARGDAEGAETILLDARDLARELGDEAAEGELSMHLAWLLLDRGYPYQARPHLDRALELDRAVDRPLDLQRLIARFAYARHRWAMAVETQRAVREQAGPWWSERDAALLAAYERALETGERVPLPGEETVPGGT